MKSAVGGKHTGVKIATLEKRLDGSSGFQAEGGQFVSVFVQNLPDGTPSRWDYVPEGQARGRRGR